MNNPLRQRVKKILQANDAGEWTRASPKLYPHQWNWDSAFIAIGLARDDRIRAQTEIRSLLRGQWRDGMLPHIIYSPQALKYFPDPHRWQIARSPEAPRDVLTSGITQPPMITVAVWELTRRKFDADFLRLVFPALLAYHRWFHSVRDPRGDGLVSIIHPWESGQDNSPRWLGILNGIRISKRPEYQREDALIIPTFERPSDDDYDRFVFLMDLARDLNYSPKEIFASAPFIVQDVMLNSILYRADECLRDLAQRLDEPVEEIEEWMAASQKAFQEKLWDAADGLFYDFDVRGGKLIRENTIAALMPLYAGLATPAQAERLLQNHMLDAREYAVDSAQSKFIVPTTSKTNHYYDPRNYWRGPIWVNMNWFMVRACERYGWRDLAEKIRADTFTLVERTGFFEYFDPRTGAGYGTDNFSWSAALAIDLLDDE